MMSMEIGIKISLDELLRYLYDNEICPVHGMNALMRICDMRNFAMCCDCWNNAVLDYFENLQMNVYEDIRDLKMEE